MTRWLRTTLVCLLFAVIVLTAAVVGASLRRGESQDVSTQRVASLSSPSPALRSTMSPLATPDDRGSVITSGEQIRLQDGSLDHYVYMPWVFKPRGPVTHYVSKRGNNTDGGSWDSAWSELDQIDWDVIEPGDLILLDGGVSEMVYITTLTVGKSGTSARPITIRLASEPGRDGGVVIFGGRSTPLPYCDQLDYQYDGDGVRSEGIRLDRVSWIVIDGRKWRGVVIYGHRRSGIRLYQPWDELETYPTCEHITFRGLEIYDNGYAQLGGDAWRPNGQGVELSGRHITFEQVIVHDNGQDAFQTGGVIEDISIRRSWLYNTRPGPTGTEAFNYCQHPDGVQIFAGGDQYGLLIEETIVGPGFMQGVILGQTLTQDGNYAVMHDVTLRHVLFAKAGNANIMGYPTVESEGWVIDHVTGGCWGGCDLAVFLEGSGHNIVNSVFSGGNVYLPDGLETLSGNCQWETTGFVLGPTADPAFADVNESDPFSLDDYTVAPSSPCAGKGSAITSVAQLLATLDIKR